MGYETVWRCPGQPPPRAAAVCGRPRRRGAMTFPPPLEGIRVLDFTRYVVGAAATRRLADLGADVVKVERPRDGDMLRVIPPRAAGQGLWHLIENAGKSSVCGDGDDAGYRALLADLAARADVLVTSGN